MNIMNFLKKNWLMILIAIQPLLDIASFFQLKYLDNSYTWIIRIIMLFFLCLICFIKTDEKKKYIFSLVPIGLFYILHICNLYRIDRLSLILDTKYFIQTFQCPILFITFIFLIKYEINNLKCLKNGVLLAYMFIIISVILSLLTNSYDSTYEGYGITGWFSSANTQSMILSAICPLVMLFVFEKKKIFLNIFVTLVSYLLLFLNGTRACYYTLIATFAIFSVMSLLNIRKNTVNKYNFITCTVFLLGSILFYNDSYTILRRNTINNTSQNYEDQINLIEKSFDEKKKEIIKNSEKNNIIDDQKNAEIQREEKNKKIEILKTSYIFRDLMKLHGEKYVYEEMENKIDSKALGDTRLMKRVNARIEIKKAGLSSNVLGIGYSTIQKNQLDLENDLSAIYYYYGIIGFVVYISYFIYLLIKAFIEFLKYPKKIFDSEYMILIFLIFILLFGGEYSGALLRKTNANIYLSIIMALLYFNCFTFKKKEAKNEKNNHN